MSLDLNYSIVIASRGMAKAKQSGTRPRKARATLNLPTDLMDEVRDCVIALSGPPTRLTVSALCERALRTELKRLKRKHRAGDDFPARASELRAGRPLGDQ